MRNAVLMILCGLTLFVGCDPKWFDNEEEKLLKEQMAKAELTLNIVDTKKFTINNFIEDYTYEYFSVADPEWTNLYKDIVSQSNGILRNVRAEGLYNVTGIENLGYIVKGSWRQTDRAEALWNVQLKYEEVTYEVVNGLGTVVCRFKKRDHFSRICGFVGYRLRETIVADEGIYRYSPLTEWQVPSHCLDRRNNNGYYDSHESYKNDKGEEAFVLIPDFVDDEYLFDYYSLDKPVSYVPPPPPAESVPSGGDGQDEGASIGRPYQYVKSVDAYTVYPDDDVDRSTLYIYKGPEGNRASWIYDPKGLHYNATETIRSGSATIDGRSYSYYISAFGVQTYFNY